MTAMTGMVWITQTTAPRMSLTPLHMVVAVKVVEVVNMVAD
jgi:hypothetical protein